MNNRIFYDAILDGDNFGKKLSKANIYNNKYWFDLGKNNPYSFTLNKENIPKKSVYYFCPLILDTTSDGVGKKLITFLQNSLNNGISFNFNEKGNIQFKDADGKENTINNPISPLGPDEIFQDLDSWDYMINRSENQGMRDYKVDFRKKGAMIINLYLSYLLYYDGVNIRLLYNPIHRKDFYNYTKLYDQESDIKNIQDLLQYYAESVVTINTLAYASNPTGTIFADPTCNCWYQNQKYTGDAGWQGDSALPNALLSGENMYDYGTYMSGVSSAASGVFNQGGKRRENCIAPACFWTIPGKDNVWGNITDTWDNCETIVDPVNVPTCMGGIYNLMNQQKNIGPQEACPEAIKNYICTNNILNQGSIKIGTNNSTCEGTGGNPIKDQRKSCLNGVCVDNPTGNYQNSTECSTKCMMDKKGIYRCDEDSGKCSKVAEGQGYTTDADKCASDCAGNFRAPKKNNTVLIIIITLIIILIIGVSAFFIIKKLKNKK